MPRHRKVRLALTPLQASALLQLAQEADADTFDSFGDPPDVAEARRTASEEGMEILRTALFAVEGPSPDPDEDEPL